METKGKPGASPQDTDDLFLLDTGSFPGLELTGS